MSADDLYQQDILDLANSADGAGRLGAPDGAAQGDSPLCGDRVRMEVRLDGGHIVALAHETKGCLLCRAAAAAIGRRAAALAGTNFFRPCSRRKLRMATETSP